MEQAGLQYAVETKTIIFQGKPIRYTSRTPIFTPEEREARKREIERVLYNIVKKYQ